MAAQVSAHRWCRAIQARTEVMLIARWLGSEISAAERFTKSVVIEGMMLEGGSGPPGDIHIHIADAARHPSPPGSELVPLTLAEDQRTLMCVALVKAGASGAVRCEVVKALLLCGPPCGFSARLRGTPSRGNPARVWLIRPGGGVLLTFGSVALPLQADTPTVPGVPGEPAGPAGPAGPDEPDD